MHCTIRSTVHRVACNTLRTFVDVLHIFIRFNTRVRSGNQNAFIFQEVRCQGVLQVIHNTYTDCVCTDTFLSRIILQDVLTALGVLEATVCRNFNDFAVRSGYDKVVIGYGNRNVVAYVCVAVQVILRLVASLEFSCFVQVVDIIDARNRGVNLVKFKVDTISTIENDAAHEVISVPLCRIQRSECTVTRRRFHRSRVVECSFARRQVNQENTYRYLSGICFRDTSDVTIRMVVIQCSITQRTRFSNRTKRQHSTLVIEFRKVRLPRPKNRQTACVQIGDEFTVVLTGTVGKQDTVFTIGKAGARISKECNLGQVLTREFYHHVGVHAIAAAVFAIESNVGNVVICVRNVIVTCVQSDVAVRRNQRIVMRRNVVFFHPFFSAVSKYLLGTYGDFLVGGKFLTVRRSNPELQNVFACFLESKRAFTRNVNRLTIERNRFYEEFIGVIGFYNHVKVSLQKVEIHRIACAIYKRRSGILPRCIGHRNQKLRRDRTLIFTRKNRIGQGIQTRLIRRPLTKHLQVTFLTSFVARQNQGILIHRFRINVLVKHNGFAKRNFLQIAFVEFRALFHRARCRQRQAKEGHTRQNRYPKFFHYYDSFL